MQTTPCRNTSGALRGIALVFAFLLFSAHPAWARLSVDSDLLGQILQEAQVLFTDDTEGDNADYIPELAKVPSELFGLALVTVDGRVFVAGDADHEFSIQSVSKPFTAALVIQEHGDSRILVEKIGVEPTGLPFNSVLAVELHPTRSVNPLVNAGAMAAVSLVPAQSHTERFSKIKQFHEALAGRELNVIEEVYRSEAATNQGNRAIAHLLKKYDRLYADPEETLDVYTRQCAIGVTARDLAVMGATLANAGVNPVSAEQVLEARHVPKVLALMLTAGFYDESGRWAYDVGLPAKTGVGGRYRGRGSRKNGRGRLFTPAEPGRQQRPGHAGHRVYQRPPGTGGISVNPKKADECESTGLARVSTGG